MSKTTTVTPAQARDELKRRQQNRKGGYTAPANQAVFRMTNAELRVIAGPDPQPHHSAKAIRAELRKQDQAPKATGRGSRGGDPIKALRADIADLFVPDKAADMAGWWDAYKATKGMTEGQLKASIKGLQANASNTDLVDA